MIVGHYLIKTYRKFKNQGIGTRFVIFGIPLFPIQSFYLFKETNRVIEIDLYWQQAVKVYSVIISVIYLFFTYIKVDKNSFQNIVIFVLIINALIYFLVDPYTKKDRIIRELLSRYVYINALPKYLGKEIASQIQAGFISDFRQKFGINWNDLLKSDKFSDDHLPLLFPIVLYESYLYKNNKTKIYLRKLFIRFKEIENIK